MSPGKLQGWSEKLYKRGKAMKSEYLYKRGKGMKSEYLS